VTTPLRATLLAAAVAGGGAVQVAHPAAAAAPRLAVTTVHRMVAPRGVLATSGGWPYCEQVRRLARRLRYTLVCGRYALDGYTGRGLRHRRHVDWGNPTYLAEFAAAVEDEHRRTGGRLVVVGVSYSGFGVATLVAHHPELAPDQLVVIDSYLDLVTRRKRLPDTHETAREIDHEAGTTVASLRRRSADAAGLAAAVRAGTRITVVWSISDHERRLFNGATCGVDASARTLQRLAEELRRPVAVWVTRTRHGVNLWRYGPRIVRGRPPGARFMLRPHQPIPPAAVCS